MNPDPVPVQEGDQIGWQPGDAHDYTIAFSDSAEPTHNPFTVRHGMPNPVHPIKGKHGCTPDPDPKHPGEFDCKYSLTKDNDPSPCADPVVHIMPGG